MPIHFAVEYTNNWELAFPEQSSDEVWIVRYHSSSFLGIFGSLTYRPRNLSSTSKPQLNIDLWLLPFQRTQTAPQELLRHCMPKDDKTSRGLHLKSNAHSRSSLLTLKPSEVCLS